VHPKRRFPDPQDHEKFLVWHKARQQAIFRKESWQLTPEEFISIWGAQWPLRGRHRTDLCMTRRDPQLPWRLDNCEIVTRLTQLRRTGLQRRRARSE
jgi:hypothetical protein